MNKQTIINAIITYKAAIRLERKIYGVLNALATDVGNSAYIDELDTVRGFIDKVIEQEFELEKVDKFLCETIMAEINEVIEEELTIEETYIKILKIVDMYKFIEEICTITVTIK